MTIQNPYQGASPSPGTTHVDIHQPLTLYCEKIYYQFDQSKMNASQCCEKLLDAANKAHWNVPDKLIRNLNVYLSKVPEKQGVSEFEVLVNKIYDSILLLNPRDKIFRSGLLCKDFIEHISQSPFFSDISTEVKGKMENIVCLSQNYYEYYFFRGWCPEKLFKYFISKLYRQYYDAQYVEFVHEIKRTQAFPAQHLGSKSSVSDVFPKDLPDSELYGTCLANAFLGVAKSRPESLNQLFSQMLKLDNSSPLEDLAASIHCKISDSEASDSINTISVTVLPMLSHDEMGSELNHFKQRVQFILCGKDPLIQTIGDFTSFLQRFIVTGAHLSVLKGFLNTCIVRVLMESQQFSDEELEDVFHYLISHDGSLPTLTDVPERTPLKDAFFAFSELTGLPDSAVRMIRWSLFMNRPTSEISKSIEDLSYTDWSRCMKSYMDDTELATVCRLGQGFGFIQQNTEGFYISRMIKQDYQYEVLNSLIEYTTYLFEFNTIEGGGSACNKKNLRRTIEKIAIDYPPQFNQIVKPKVHEIVEHFKNPEASSIEVDYRCTCLLLQFALGFLNSYVDKDIGGLFLEELESIEDVAQRRELIKRILSHLTQERITAVGNKIGDDQLFQKVKHELTSRLHPNFLHDIWLFVTTTDGQLYRDISFAMRSDMEWWNILFNEKQQGVLVYKLVEAISSKLSDESAATIYPFLSLLVDTYKTPEAVATVGNLFLNELQVRAGDSGDAEEYINGFFMNLMSCMTTKHWNHYHTELQIYQNSDYLVEELVHRPVCKSFLQTVIDEVFQNEKRFGNAKEIIIEAVSGNPQWFDLFFNAITIETRLMTFLSSVINRDFQYNTKVLTREIMMVCGSMNSLQYINRSVEFTCEFLITKNMDEKNLIVVRLFELLKTSQLHCFFSYNEEEFSIFIERINHQNETLGTNFITSLFGKLREQSWFKELTESYLSLALDQQPIPDVFSIR